MSSCATHIAVFCALGLLYLACFGLFQAAQQRATIGLLATSETARFGAKTAACFLLLLSFLLVSQLQSMARAIPIWLGMLSFVGASNLLIAAMIPAQHNRSAVIAALVSLTSGLWLGIKVLIWA